MKFKIGDRVIFRSKPKNANYGIIPHRDGQSLKIIQTDDFDPKIPYKIQFDDGTNMWMYEHHLEAIPSELKAEEPAPEVKTEELSSKKDIMLTDEASEHLSKRLKMKFKVGDKVKTTKDHFSIPSGSLGIVDCVDKNNDGVPYSVLFPCGRSFWFTESKLEPASEEKIAEPAPLNLDEIIGDLRKENDKLKKQIKLLTIMLQGRGYDSLAIASALELLD